MLIRLGARDQHVQRARKHRVCATAALRCATPRCSVLCRCTACGSEMWAMGRRCPVMSSVALTIAIGNFAFRLRIGLRRQKRAEGGEGARCRSFPPAALTTLHYTTLHYQGCENKFCFLFSP